MKDHRFSILIWIFLKQYFIWRRKESKQTKKAEKKRQKQENKAEGTGAGRKDSSFHGGFFIWVDKTKYFSCHLLNKFFCFCIILFYIKKDRLVEGARKSAERLRKWWFRKWEPIKNKKKELKIKRKQVKIAAQQFWFAVPAVLEVFHRALFSAEQ